MILVEPRCPYCKRLNRVYVTGIKDTDTVNCHHCEGWFLVIWKPESDIGKITVMTAKILVDEVHTHDMEI